MGCGSSKRKNAVIKLDVRSSSPASPRMHKNIDKNKGFISKNTSSKQKKISNKHKKDNSSNTIIPQGDIETTCAEATSNLPAPAASPWGSSAAGRQFMTENIDDILDVSTFTNPKSKHCNDGSHTLHSSSGESGEPVF